ncbi:hypothetical protein MN608_08986 [Microdochium nivale]|nr:hypothetical protein MN608_08986 [Microdochium nivale]
MPRAPRRSAARRPVEPTSPSPPQTPTTTSPKAGRKAPPPARMASKQSPTANRRGAAPKNLHPLGGTRFSYSRNLRPEDLSPCSSKGSSDAEENETGGDTSASDKVDVTLDDVDSSDDEDEDSQDSDEEEEDDEADEVGDEKIEIPVFNPFQPLSDHVPPPFVEFTRIAAAITITEDHLIIEDMGEYELDSDDGEVLLPYAFEYPESEPSRPRSRSRRELDPMFQRNFEDLNPFDDTDEEQEEEDDGEFERHRQAQRMERRIRRMKSGSISKRTVSERDSDSDREDVSSYCDVNDSGSLFRRTRRKTDRHSMQFSGQFPERIEELKEPNSDDEIIFEDAELFARELPFWTFMDVDSE